MQRGLLSKQEIAFEKCVSSLRKLTVKMRFLPTILVIKVADWFQKMERNPVKVVFASALFLLLKEKTHTEELVQFMKWCNHWNLTFNLSLPWNELVGQTHSEWSIGYRIFGYVTRKTYQICQRIQLAIACYPFFFGSISIWKYLLTVSWFPGNWLLPQPGEMKTTVIT